MALIKNKRTVALIWALTFDELLADKPLLKLNGKHVVSHMMDSVLESRAFDHCFLFTDSEDVAELGEKNGVKSIIGDKTVSSLENYNKYHFDMAEGYWQLIGEYLAGSIGTINTSSGINPEQKAMSSVADIYLVADVSHCLIRPETLSGMVLKLSELDSFSTLIPVYRNPSPTFTRMENGTIFPLTTMRPFYTVPISPFETLCAKWGIRLSNCFKPDLNKPSLYPYNISPDEVPSLMRKEDIGFIDKILRKDDNK